MQDDGKKTVEDDLIDDDMDFGDFDDDFEDDLDVDLGDDLDGGVDDWDGVDEDLDAGSESLGSAPPKDSFVKKNFNLIVIGVAVIGGGTFVLGQMGGTPAPIPVSVDQISASEQAVEVDMGEMPPAPNPVDVDADAVVSGLPFEEGVQPDYILDDSALTPLPPLDGGNAELEPLDFLSDDVVDVPPVAADVIAEEDASLSVAALPVEDDAGTFEPDLEVANDDALVDLAVMPTIEAEPEEEFLGLPVLEDELIVEANEVVEPVQVVESVEVDVSADMENDESAALVVAQDKAAELEGTVDDLKAELEAMKASLNEARMAEKRALESKAVVAAPVSSEKKVENVPAKAVVTAPPPKKPAVKAVVEASTWVLRAAQPGKAMIFNSKTQDVLNVESGDDVPGLGVVRSISVQDGQWVVQGAKGRVTQ